MVKECKWYLTEFCCKDLDSGRVWDCTAPDKKTRSKITHGWLEKCEYPKLRIEKGAKNESN